MLAQTAKSANTQPRSIDLSVNIATRENTRTNQARKLAKPALSDFSSQGTAKPNAGTLMCSSGIPLFET